MHRSRPFRTLAILLLVALPAITFAQIELIPRSVLFGNPERTDPEISPDGTMLAYLAPDQGVLNVWVRTLGKTDDRVITNDRKRGIRNFSWQYDSKSILYGQDQGGDENWRLYDVDLDAPAAADGQAGWAKRDLTPFEGIQARVIAARKSHRDEVLVGINRDNPQLHDVYRLDLVTGELTKIADNPGFIDWIADAQLTVRGTIAPQPDGSLVVLVRDSADADWRPLIALDEK